MATEFTDYPEALDAFENPTEFDALDSVDVPHWAQESQQNDAIEALETVVGITGSLDADSHEYKIAALIAGTLGGAIVTSTGASPEGVTSASPGAFLWDTTLKALYIKETGTGDTGWFPLMQFT